jgi:hypothetical protein
MDLVPLGTESGAIPGGLLSAASHKVPAALPEERPRACSCGGNSTCIKGRLCSCGTCTVLNFTSVFPPAPAPPHRFRQFPGVPLPSKRRFIMCVILERRYRRGALSFCQLFLPTPFAMPAPKSRGPCGCRTQGCSDQALPVRPQEARGTASRASSPRPQPPPNARSRSGYIYELLGMHSKGSFQRKLYEVRWQEGRDLIPPSPQPARLWSQVSSPSGCAH